MARPLITTEISGFDEVMKALDDAVDGFDDAIVYALNEQELFLEDEIRKSYLSAGGKSGDFIYNSIGHSVNPSSIDNGAVGTVGVYKLDSVMTPSGRDADKDITAPTVAYWMEYGTSRATKYGDIVIHQSPRPFLSSAMYKSIPEQEKIFKAAFIESVGDTNG